MRTLVHKTSGHRAFLTGWGVVIGIPALFVLAYFYVRIPIIGTFNACAVRHFLGVPCPGCGLTGSFINLTHGGIRESVDAHPLGIVIAAWLLYQFGRGVIAAVFKRQPGTLLTQGKRDVLLWIFLAALIIQWAARLIYTK